MNIKRYDGWDYQGCPDGDSIFVDDLKELLKKFDYVLDEWDSGRPAVKLVYGITEEHFKILSDLRKALQ